MAHLIAVTPYAHVKTGSPNFTITLSQAATAGSTLVLLANGGTIVSPPAGWTKRSTYGGGAQDVSVSDVTATGGETTLACTMNGAAGDNTSGVVFEFGPGLTFVGWSNNGAGTSVSATSDWQVGPTSPVAVTGPAVAVASWSIGTSTAYSASNRFHQLGPNGSIAASGGNQPGTDYQFLWSVAVADVDATHQYPQHLSAGNYAMTSSYLVGGSTCFMVQALYADTSGVATVVPTANPIVKENRLPGTDYGNWFLGDNGTNATIAGYTDKCSYAVGDTVNMKVDSTGHAFRVEIYRLGAYYRDNFAARNVLGNQAGYITGTVTTQPAPTVDGTLGSTSCAWTTNATWTIPAGTPSGLYYYLLRRTDDTTQVASGHFVVRDSSVVNKIAVVIPDLTHQAYNAWGGTGDVGSRGVGTVTGRNLYQAGPDGGTANFAHRAYAVSFDRPYSIQATQDATYIFDATHNFITFAEAQGYNLTYLSDLDLHANPTILDGAAMVVVIGHHEYWSTNVYNAFQRSVNTGSNMVNLASNTALWHVRFAAGDTNYRTMICYKESGTRDVSAGWAGNGYDPVSYTGTWRDTGSVNGRANPDVRRENFFGQMFVASGPINSTAVVPFAAKTSPIWRNSASIQALTAGQSYTTSIAVVGYEVDSADGSAGQPANQVFLWSSTSYTFSAGTNPAGTTYGTSVTPIVGWTLAQISSGALLFSTGNWRGLVSISRWRTSTTPSGTSVDLNWQNAVLAIMYDLGQPPATMQSMRPGEDTDLTDPSTGAPAQPRSSVAKAYGLATVVPLFMTTRQQAANRASTY